MAYFDGIKAGYKVYSLTDGEGAVTRVYSQYNTYPIVVNFDGAESTFTMNGFYNISDKTQSLYWQKPEIIDKGKPKDPLIKGAAYWVWMDGRDGKWLRIYSHSSNACDFFENDAFWNSQGGYSAWSNYELFRQPSAVAELSDAPEGVE